MEVSQLEHKQEVNPNNKRSLFVLNDNENTFEWVIICLRDICGLTVITAEQCAYIVHFKGSCSVKSGDFETLKPMKDELAARGLKVIIK